MYNKFTYKISSFVIIILLLLLLPLQSISKEIPVTVKKGEARDLFMKARTLNENLQIDKAREVFKDVVKLDKNCALAHLNLSQLSTSLKERNMHLEKALKLTDDISKGERLLIEAANAGVQNNPQKRGQLLDQLVKSYPDDKRARTIIGFYYNGRDKDDLAIMQLKKAIEIDKKYAPAYNLLGYAYLKTEQFDKSEEAFKKYISLIPNEANPHDSIADLYTKMGKHFIAIDHYKKALELDETFDASQRKIGDNLIFVGKFEEARKAYEKANTISMSENAKLINQTRIARSWLYEGKTDMALSEMDKVIQKAKTVNLPEWQAGSSLAKCLIALENDKLKVAEQSIKMCKNVMKNSKLPTYTVNNLNKNILFSEALIEAKNEYFKEADKKFASYEKAVKKGSNPKEMENVHQLSGLIAIEKGEFGMAVKELRQADQQDPITLYNLGVAYSKTGDKKQANIFYTRASEWNVNGLGYAIIHNNATAALSTLATED
jgi:tetratricopeptide (TPR) repeat protein